MRPKLSFNVIKDINGQFVTIKTEDLIQYLLESDFTIFGMNIETIKELRNQYLLHGGKMDITPERVKEVFSK